MVLKAPRWAVFISGNGSNLQALIDCPWAIQNVLVVSSRSRAQGLLRARRAGVPTLVLSSPVNWKELDEQLRYRRVDAIALCGFMKVLPPEFVSLWKERIINIHPSLLPAFPGLNSIERSYHSNEGIGCTAHLVTEEVDGGEVLRQRAVRRESTLAETEFLVHLAEHRILREVISKWKRGPMS